MLAHPGGDEWACRHHLEPLLADRLERAAHQRRADAAAAERFRYFGVHQRDHAGLEAVVEGGDMALGLELEALERGIVANGPAHGCPYSAGCTRARRLPRRRAARIAIQRLTT